MISTDHYDAAFLAAGEALEESADRLMELALQLKRERKSGAYSEELFERMAEACAVMQDNLARYDAIEALGAEPGP
jgi:hypothetical protein